jgi:DNA-binding response OmpR family regulator
MAKILIVDDDEELVERLTDWLRMENHIVDSVADGKDALQMLRGFTYDVVVLDWSLPGKSGIDVCKQFRHEGGHTPILFLTGKTDIDSREEGLDGGADDYLVKPFDARELSARIRSLLRRPAVSLRTELNVNGVVLDPTRRTATASGVTVQLKPKESNLLEYFMRHPNRMFSSKELLEAVWSSESDASSETVRTWMKFLRRQLTVLGRQDMIKTVLVSGYILNEPYEAE